MIDLGIEMDKVLEYLNLKTEDEISFETAAAVIKAKKLKEAKNA